jgi:hypothetical protein
MRSIFPVGNQAEAPLSLNFDAFKPREGETAIAGPGGELSTTMTAERARLSYLCPDHAAPEPPGAQSSLAWRTTSGV